MTSEHQAHILLVLTNSTVANQQILQDMLFYGNPEHDIAQRIENQANALNGLLTYVNNHLRR